MCKFFDRTQALFCLYTPGKTVPRVRGQHVCFIHARSITDRQHTELAACNGRDEKISLTRGLNDVLINNAAGALRM